MKGYRKLLTKQDRRLLDIGRNSIARRIRKGYPLNELLDDFALLARAETAVIHEAEMADLIQRRTQLYVQLRFENLDDLLPAS